MNSNLNKIIIEKFDEYIDKGIEETGFGKKLAEQGYDIKIIKNMSFRKSVVQRVENYKRYMDTLISFSSNSPLTFREGEDIQFEVNLDTGKISLSALATNEMWVELDREDVKRINNIMEIIHAMYISTYHDVKSAIEKAEKKLFMELVEKLRGTAISVNVYDNDVIAERNRYAIKFEKENLANKKISSYIIENLKEKTTGNEDIEQILSIAQDINKILSEMNDVTED